MYKIIHKVNYIERDFVMRIFSKFLALLLAFLIGFVACIAAIVGAGFFIYSNVSIDMLNESGIANIDTSERIDRDSADVLLTSLTIADLMLEIEEIKSLGEDATIDYLIERYGLIISEELSPFLTEEMRQIPITEIGSGDGKLKMLKALTIGGILGYDREDNPDYTLGSDESEYVWYKDGEKVTGINAILADYSIYRLLDEGIDTAALSNDLTIADLLGLTVREDLPIYLGTDVAKTKIDGIAPIKIWYNDDGTRTDKIISAVAHSTFSNVGAPFEELYIADVIGYVKYENNYYSWTVKNDDGEYILLTLEDGITSEFADLTVKKVSEGALDDKVSDIRLAKVLNYQVGDDGKYYHNGDEVTGIMAILADDKVGEIGSNVGLIKVGEVAGYTYHDGVWYSTYDENYPSNNVEAKGILAALSDVTVDEMSDEAALSGKIRNVAVADVLGYELRDDGKYYEDSSATEPISGIMAVIADTPVNEISSKIDETEMGELMGFTKTKVPVIGEDGVTLVGYEDVWVDKSGNKVHVLMQTVSGTLFKDIGNLTDDLTIADLIEKEDRQTGFIALVPEDTNINNLASTMGNIFNEKTLADFIECDALDLSENETAKLLENGFGNYTIPDIFKLIIDLDIQAPAK